MGKAKKAVAKLAVQRVTDKDVKIFLVFIYFSPYINIFKKVSLFVRRVYHIKRLDKESRDRETCLQYNNKKQYLFQAKFYA
jgi:hypothetical protein